MPVEPLRLGFILDRLGFDNDDEHDEVRLESPLIDDLVDTGVVLPLVCG